MTFIWLGRMKLIVFASIGNMSVVWLYLLACSSVSPLFISWLDMDQTCIDSTLVCDGLCRVRYWSEILTFGFKFHVCRMEVGDTNFHLSKSVYFSEQRLYDGRWRDLPWVCDWDSSTNSYSGTFWFKACAPGEFTCWDDRCIAGSWYVTRSFTHLTFYLRFSGKFAFDWVEICPFFSKWARGVKSPPFTSELKLTNRAANTNSISCCT